MGYRDLAGAARIVISSWETGDLAAAVDLLEETLDVDKGPFATRLIVRDRNGNTIDVLEGVGGTYGIFKWQDATVELKPAVKTIVITLTD